MRVTDPHASDPPASPDDTGQERRGRPRYSAADIQLSVNGHSAVCEDMSVAGLRISHDGLKENDLVEIGLAFDGINVLTPARVIAADHGRYSLTFQAPTYSLMHLIVQYLSKRHGVSPHTFR